MAVLALSLPYAAAKIAPSSPSSGSMRSLSMASLSYGPEVEELGIAATIASSRVPPNVQTRQIKESLQRQRELLCCVDRAYVTFLDTFGKRGLSGVATGQPLAETTA